MYYNTFLCTPLLTLPMRNIPKTTLRRHSRHSRLLTVSDTRCRCSEPIRSSGAKFGGLMCGGDRRWLVSYNGSNGGLRCRMGFFSIAFVETGSIQNTCNNEGKLNNRDTAKLAIVTY